MQAVLGPVEIVICYEVGYDGFWLARLLAARGIRTIVFDPASFLRPRRARLAKTDRLDAEEMTRILRTWLSGDHAIATAVHIPTVEGEDAKRIERERKNLVEERTRIVGRIKGLLALHGIWLSSKGINKRLRGRLDTMITGDGRPLPPFLRRDIERMIRHHEFICSQLAEVEADRKVALTDEMSSFPHRDKVRRLATLGSVGETTATVLVAEVFHRTFETRRHLASFIGLAPSPYASGDVSRDRGINKAGTKLARQTLVELAWFWLRYQPNSKLTRWWHEAIRQYGHARQEGWHRRPGPQTGDRVVAVRRTGRRTGRRDAQGLKRRNLYSRACRQNGKAGWRPRRLMALCSPVVVWSPPVPFGLRRT